MKCKIYHTETGIPRNIEDAQEKSFETLEELYAWVDEQSEAIMIHPQGEDGVRWIEIGRDEGEGDNMLFAGKEV